MATILVSSCGGGGGVGVSAPVAQQASPPAQAPTSLLVIGNSITAGFGYGMAATGYTTDFAGVAAQALNLPVTREGFVDIETSPLIITQADIDAKVKSVDARTAVIVELGDNATPLFADAYVQLVTTLKRSNRLACTSTFWQQGAVDDVIRAACESAGGKYVFIGDIQRDPANRDLIDGPQYADRNINRHPHDWSMAVIGARVAAALK